MLFCPPMIPLFCGLYVTASHSLRAYHGDNVLFQLTAVFYRRASGLHVYQRCVYGIVCPSTLFSGQAHSLHHWIRKLGSLYEYKSYKLRV